MPRSGLDGARQAGRGHFTQKTAEAVLQAILTDARRGTLAGAQKSGANFADATAEYLRFVSDVRQIDADTAADYRGVIQGYLIPSSASGRSSRSRPMTSTLTRRG